MLWMYMVQRRRWGVEVEIERPSFWKTAIVLLLSAGMVIFPVVLYNVRCDRVEVGEEPKSIGLKQFVSAGFLPIASNLGINFYLGNHWELREINNIDNADFFEFYQRIENEPAERGIKSPLAQSRYLVRQTLIHIFEKPADFIKLMGLKIFQLFNGAEIPRNANLYAFRQYSVVFSVLLWKKIIAFPSGLIIPLGLVGIFLSRDLWRRHFLLLSCLVVQYLFILAFFVTARYRLPTIPLLAIYTAFTMGTFVRCTGQGAKRKLTVPVVLLVVFILFSNSFTGRIRADHWYSEYINLGNALFDEGKIDEAMFCYNEAVKGREVFEARWRLAKLLAGRGGFEQADKLLAETEDMAARRLEKLEKEQTQEDRFFGLFQRPATVFKLTELQMKLHQLRSLIGTENRTNDPESEKRLARFVMLNPHDTGSYAKNLDELLEQMGSSDPLRDNILLAKAKLVADEQLRAEELSRLHKKSPDSDGGMQALYELARLKIGLYQSESNTEHKKKYLAETRALLTSFISLYPDSFYAGQAKKNLDNLPKD
jgi:tetratricopeptide (TPR) repeat protein